MCGFLCAVAPAVAGASETTQVDAPEILAQIQPLDRFQAEQERLREILKNQPPAYTDRDRDLLTALLSRAALVVEATHTASLDRAVSETMQRALLPELLSTTAQLAATSGASPFFTLTAETGASDGAAGRKPIYAL